MDTFFDYIVDAAYKIEQFTEDDLFGATQIEGKSTSFAVNVIMNTTEIGIIGESILIYI